MSHIGSVAATGEQRSDLLEPAGREVVLAGPLPALDPAVNPVRGDLADVRLAGRVFVANYAVPLVLRIGDHGATLRRAAQAGAEALAELAPGTAFAALDLTANWAWGQAGGEHGPVGYVARGALGA